MAIAVFFVFFITGLLAYGSHYECENFDKNHGLNKRKKKKLAHARVRAH
jgi:hypothetical protein